MYDLNEVRCLSSGIWEIWQILNNNAAEGGTMLSAGYGRPHTVEYDDYEYNEIRPQETQLFGSLFTNNVQ